MAFAQAQVPAGTFANTTATTIAQAYGSNVTAGNLLVCHAGWRLATGSATATDTQGNTWFPIAASLGANATFLNSCQVLWAIAGSTGANTVTVTTSSSPFRLIGVHEFSGNDGVSPLDVGGAASGNSTTPAASVTTGLDHELTFGGCVVANTASAGAGYTVGLSGVGYDGNGTEYDLDTTPAGAASVAFSQTTGQWVASAAAFKLPVSVAIYVPHRMPLGA